MWYVIQTIKGKEKEAVENIRADIAGEGEEVFIIENEKMYKHQGKWTPDRTNLFAGYLFVDSRDPENFDRRLRKKYRPLKLIRVGDKITPIFPREEALLLELGGEDHVVRYSEGFKKGVMAKQWENCSLRMAGDADIIVNVGGAKRTRMIRE